MNYKVTFYKNTLELLTERKANYVNQLKKLSSKITYELFKKIDGNGKGTDKIINFMKSMIERGKSFHTLKLTIPDYINPLIAHLPNTGKEIPIYIIFQKTTSNDDLGSMYMEGVCSWSHSKIAGKTLIKKIEVTINFNDKIIDNDMNILRAMFINKFQSTLVHELAHSRDSENPYETEDRNKAASTHGTVTSLHYYLKPTEIRSHMNEVFKELSARKHKTPERYMRNSYKNAIAAEEASGGKMKFDKDEKDYKRKLYGILKQGQKSSTISKEAWDILWGIINRSLLRKESNNLKKFIRSYHVAFVRDYNEITKQRYYDKLFKDIDVPSIEQMNTFFEEIKTIYRSLMRLKNEVEKALRARYEISDEDRQMVAEFNDMITGKMWDRDEFQNIFIDYNPKQLKKVAKEIIESFREEHGFMTKGMLTKKAKAWRKENGL